MKNPSIDQISALINECGLDPLVLNSDTSDNPEFILALLNQLKEKSERLAELDRLFDVAPEAILVHDFLSIRRINQAFLKLTGYTNKSELVNLPLLETLVYEEDHITAKAFRKKLIESDKPRLTCKVRLLMADGSSVPVEASASLIDFEGRKCMHMIIRDVTDIQILEDQQKESEGKYREIVNSLSDILVRVNSAGIVELVSPSVRKFGYKPEEIIGKPAIDFYVNKYDRDSYIKSIKEKGSCEQFETALHDSKGNIRYISATGKLYKDNIGGYGIESLFRDITLLKKQQDEITNNALILRNFFDMAPIGIALNDMDGNFLEVNIEFSRFTGYNLNELNRLSYWDLTPEKYAKQEEEQLDLLSQFNAYGPYEKEYIHKNGKTFPVLLKGIKITDLNGDEFIWSVVQDISEQKEVQSIKEEFTKNLETKVKERTQDLESARKKLAVSLEKERELGALKSHFVATASHQFRTPLSVIQANVGMLDMLKDNLVPDFKPKFEKIYDRISGQISRMTNLMDDVLILGKINSGGITMISEPVNLISIAESVCALYNEIQEDGRVMEINVSGEERELMLDSQLVEHAFSNLVSNAFKYSKNRPSPKMDIAYLKNTVAINIEDFGIGIPNYDLTNVFEPFHRANNVEDIAGTGLGMAIAKEYISMNEGEIVVNSKLGEGTRYTVILKG